VVSATNDGVFRRVAVQIVHRHGDRTPITSLLDESYWASQLIAKETLEKMDQHTTIIEETSSINNDETAASDINNAHTAHGRGPFGKLTQLGLLQMVALGSRLREHLTTNVTIQPPPSPPHSSSPMTLRPLLQSPIRPSDVRVISTPFERTIQSAQGLLLGLITPNDDNHHDDGHSSSFSTTTKIHVYNIRWGMIPDPQPRKTHEQAVLERSLSKRPHIIAREREMLPLAVRATRALHEYLAPDAHEAKFGVEEEEKTNDEEEEEESIETEPLSWNQLAEITKCLAVRDKMPSSLSLEDQERISHHVAWRWFQTFRNPRVSYLAMHTMTEQMMQYFLVAQNPQQPPFTIWSAHDSTLISLLCAFRLEQPSVWPEYASYLMLELLEKDQELFVQFSLNGEILQSQWENMPSRRLIPFQELVEHIRSQEAVTQSYTMDAATQ
jgi:acid phosphatase